MSQKKKKFSTNTRDISHSTYTGEFLIRIVLKHGQSLKKYLETVLKPRVRMIDGVSLQSISDLEKVN